MKTLLAVIAIVAFLAPPAISDEPPLKHSEFVFARLQVPNTADGFRTANQLHGPEALHVLRSYLKRAVPEFELVKLDICQPIFHSFYHIDTLKMEPPYGREPGKETPGFIPEFWGLSDQKGNLRLIANYNNDLGE